MNRDKIIAWLMKGDPVIRWQVMRDLEGYEESMVEAERKKMITEGWTAKLLSLQDDAGMWGGGYYTPKWTSTHYTLLLLRFFGLPKDIAQAHKACRLLLEHGFYKDGGINYWSVRMKHSEDCVTGMLLSMLCYFRYGDERIHAITEYLLRQQLADDGWNCRVYAGDEHSSFHTTISVLEGFWEYEQCYPERSAAVLKARERGHEFLFRHKLYQSHRTGKLAFPAVTRFSFPPHWHYDLLRGLDYLRACCAAYDERMKGALDVVRTKQNADGYWILQNRYKGSMHFEMEEPGLPSRWNTLRALRILARVGPQH
ncbi:MAG: hypothetical protein A2Y62_19295 [Candidatus Fischerbacteria bacterium RBG_13_37_8]|uniref:Squalene cyclase C-terminal domain-containing protein n=1 Tax=Candidatus Fischerbacteria bacterium RBG_13_37_8 TaxID=1817863 RepID=A0A1F5VXM5_9BACT|nr:MAG: hypothetical protein A2Y62_19295 [Candidatus Fischerbacteria bacterium RBG_13_37_8]